MGLTENRKYMIQGYLKILETGKPNGRHVHEVGNKIQVLRWRLKNELDLTEQFESELRKLIRFMYHTEG